MATATEGNSLGLEFNDKEPTPPPPSSTQEVDDTPANETAERDQESKEKDIQKKKPYVNPDRFKTGGSQRDKLSEEELTERMERIKLQNEKIKQRRIDVQADEAAFLKTQTQEKAKQANTKKIQESIDKAREQNAKRKMDKVQSREWDSGKPSPGGRREGDEEQGGWARGRGRGRGRGGGRGAAPRRTDSDAGKDSEKTESTTTAPAPASAPAPEKPAE